MDENKEDPLDFALWKFVKPGEPRWPFEPYRQGRPGWHIECSAMARALLDPPGLGFDIHGGGADLIFPHHENEIAQSEPLMAQPPMANFWVHGGLLLFDNRKMAKSLGNFEPLSDMLLRHDPQAIRWLFLQTGYRKVMNFTEDSIAAAGLGLSARSRRRIGSRRRGAMASRRNGRQFDARMEAALDDDMNTAAALAVLYEFAATAPVERSALRGSAILGIEPNESWIGASPSPSSLRSSSNGCKPRSTRGARRAPRARLRVCDRTKRSSESSRCAPRRAQREGLGGLRSACAMRLQRCGVELHDTKEGTSWTTS